MEQTPNLSVAIFERLGTGDLFIVTEPDAFIAIKGFEQKDGDTFVVPIGPELPKGMAIPSLMAWCPDTVISFGKSWVLRLPVSPHAWRTTDPAPELPCLALVHGEPYFRVNSAPTPGHYMEAFVSARTGHVEYALSPIRAYALEWEIELPDRPGHPAMSIAFPGSKHGK